MKKLLITFACVAGLALSQFANANPYTLDEVALEQTFASADEVALNNSTPENLTGLTNTNMAPTEVTMGGFMLRLIFCGGFAVHRSYTGTKGLFWKYFCALGIPSTGDFCFSIFHWKNALDNYNGNPNWICWTKKGRQI